MGMEFTENKGPPTPEDAQEAIDVVGKYLITGITKLPPELAVQMGNILRCLNMYKTVAHEHRKGTMIDEEWGWCLVCGNERVHVAGGIDTCKACIAKG